MLKTGLFLSFFIIINSAFGQTKSDSLITEKVVAEKEKKWFEWLSIKGYMQVRYNRFFETNKDLKCEQCDKSWGENGGIFIRRARMIFSGYAHERVYMYFQMDLASSASSTEQHFAQIRDAYFDVGIDKRNRFRIRLGQSKVPFGFDNLQSSQYRMPLDRSDGINSSLLNERDIGAYFMWAPTRTRKLFASLITNGLKGSGDYGVFAFGAFNGQTANKPELNNEPHIVARLTYPLQLKNQIIEASFQAYSGKYVIASDKRSAGVKANKDWTYNDQRIGATFVLFPKPFGIQADYNIGIGPSFDKALDSITTQPIEGGYITISFLKKIKKQTIIPFIRIQYFKGGKKAELDARSYEVSEIEIGVEWQLFKHVELTAMYTISERRFEDFKLQNNFQKGQLLRLQTQITF